MVNPQASALVSIKIVDGADHYPKRVIEELATLTAMLRNIRKVYLVTTKSDAGDYVPLLMMEAVGDSERRIDDDVFVLESAMNVLFRDVLYEIQVLPQGPWWEQIKPIAQVVRDLNS